MSDRNGTGAPAWGDLDEAGWQELQNNIPQIVARMTSARYFRYRPPSNGVLEALVLGALLTRPLALPECLLASDFIDPVHRSIYLAVQRCHEKKLRSDPVNVAIEMTDRPDLIEVGGTAYLSQLVSAAEATDPTSWITQAANTISELAHARVLLGDLDDIQGLMDAHEEQILDPVALGAGRARAHLLAMDLIGLAHRVLDRSAGWA